MNPSFETLRIASHFAAIKGFSLQQRDAFREETGRREWAHGTPEGDRGCRIPGSFVLRRCRASAFVLYLTANP